MFGTRVLEYQIPDAKATKCTHLFLRSNIL